MNDLGLIYYNNTNGEILVIKCNNKNALEEDKQKFDILNRIPQENISTIEFQKNNSLFKTIFPERVDLNLNEVIFKDIVLEKENEIDRLKRENAELIYQLMLKEAK